MGKNKTIISAELLKQIEVEKMEKISKFLNYFEKLVDDGELRKADWNFLMPRISLIETLDDAFVYLNKDSAEISYSTEKIHFNISVRHDGNDESKFSATLNVVNSFISWALKNL